MPGIVWSEKMHEFAICIKTYRRNLDFFETLSNSLEAYNKAQFPIAIICPKEDIALFQSRITNSVVFADEDLVPETKSIRGLSEGYITAELCKLNYYKLGFSRNVLFVDDDSKFIKDFNRQDFFDNQGNLYTVITQDKDLIIDPSYRSYSISRSKDLKAIYETFCLENSRLLQVQMNALVSCQVLEELMERALPELGINQFQALDISPFEYNWYTIWLQKSNLIPIVPIEPLFKTFHVREQYVAALSQGITEEEIAHAYIGVVHNSSWFRSYQSESRIKKYITDLRTDKYYLRHIRTVKRFFSPID
jgi:hypothetical protein